MSVAESQPFPASPGTRHKSVPRSTGSSADLDVLPETDAAGGHNLGGLRRLVDPGIARVAHAVDHHVVELDAVRAFQVLCGLRNLLEPLHPYRRRRKIEVAAVFDDVVALGDQLAVQGGFHVGTPGLPRACRRYETGWIHLPRALNV